MTKNQCKKRVEKAGYTFDEAAWLEDHPENIKKTDERQERLELIAMGIDPDGTDSVSIF